MITTKLIWHFWLRYRKIKYLVQDREARKPENIIMNIINSDLSDPKAHGFNQFNALRLSRLIPIFSVLLHNSICIFSMAPHVSVSFFPTIVRGSQERALDALELEIQEVLSFLIWCWQSNSGPLEKQQVLFT